MKIAVESVGSYQRKIQITVPAAQVKSELDAAFKTLARKARLPGFRPGKAPRQVLEARFGDGVRDDVANKLIQSGYRDAVQRQNLEPVGQPTLGETGALVQHADFAFTVVVEVKPDIVLTKTVGVEVVYPPNEVSDAELDATVRARLEGQARLVEVSDRAVERGDMVLVELEVKDGDTVVASEPGTMIRTEADPYYPGLEDFLVGVEAGKAKKGSVTYRSDARTESVAGRTLDTTVKVISIQHNEVPELTDAIAEELGFPSAEGMRAELRSQIEDQRSGMARNQARANLLEALIKANPFEVPSSMVDSSLEMLLQELRLQQAYMGRDPRSLSFTDAQLADLRMRAEFASKAGLILEKVGQLEDLAITADEIEAKYQEMAAERGQSVEAVRGRFAKPGALDDLKARMLEEKTLDWLLDRATVVSAPAEAAPAAAPEKKEKKAKKAKADAPAEPVAEAAPAPEAAPAAEADLSVLKGAVGKIEAAIASGAHDADLAALLDAEKSGKARKGAVAAIEKRIAELG